MDSTGASLTNRSASRVWTAILAPYISPALVGWLALALGGIALCYGLWHYHDILRAQPIWPPGAVSQALTWAGIYAVVVLVLRALPAFATKVTASLLVVAFLAFAAGPRAVLGAVLVGVACLAAGDRLLRRSASPSRLADRMVLSSLVGASLFALLVTFTAHFPVNRAAFFSVVCAVVIALDARGLLSFWRRIVAWYRRPRAEGDRWTYPSAALLGGIVLLQSVRALLPETGGDGLGMHLVVASQLAAHHQWSFDPHLFEWAFYPMASEWLQGIGWTLGGESAARLIQFGFMLATLALIVLVARRFTSPSAALLAGSLFASAGLAMGFAANTYAEPALAAFSVAAFAVATLPRDRWSIWTTLAFGVLAGGCLLTKITALYLLIPLIALLAVRLIREGGWRWALRHTALGCATLVAVGAAPYVYALAQTGNPVFPLYNGIFRSELAPISRPSDPRWYGHFSWKIPYVATFRSSYYWETYNGTLGFQYLLFVPLALVIIVWRRLRTAAVALIIGLSAAVALLASMQYVRYVFPMAALVSIALAAALASGPTQASRRLAQIAVALAVGVVALNLLMAPGGQWNLPGFDGAALLSSSARQAFEDKYAPQRALTKIVNREAGSDARVAYFGPAYATGLHGTPLLAMGYNPDFLKQTVQASTGQQMLRVLSERDVSHVIATQDLAAAGTPLGDALASGAEQMASVNGASLYRLAQ